MKIDGHHSLSIPLTTVTLPRPSGSPVTFTIQPLPFGFHRRLRLRGIVPPVPPARVVRDSSGRPLRDEQGMALLKQDHHAAAYLDQLELYHQRVAVLSIVEALAQDKSVTFATRAPDGDAGWDVFADRIHEELVAAGFSAGDIVYLCRQICRVSNLADGHFEAQQRNFS